MAIWRPKNPIDVKLVRRLAEVKHQFIIKLKSPNDGAVFRSREKKPPQSDDNLKRVMVRCMWRRLDLAQVNPEEAHSPSNLWGFSDRSLTSQTTGAALLSAAGC